MPDDVDPFRRVKAFSGTGTLKADGSELPCRFDAYQRGDGAIVIDCDGDDTRGMHPLAWDVQLTGTTDTGQHVVSHEAHVTGSTFRMMGKHQGPNIHVRLIAAGLDMSTGTSPRTLRYGLTNLRETLRKSDRLHLGEFEILIEHRADANTIIKELNATHGIALTAEATLSATSGHVTAADETISKLCHLLTLAQGSTVSWIYRDSLDELGEVVATFCGNAITKPYGAPHQLIADHDTYAFVQETFPAWDDAAALWEIRNAILGYTDAKIEVDYFELRALKMAVVIEHLKRVYLERTGREYTMPQELFEGKFEDLRSRIMAVLKQLFPDQTGATLGRLLPGLRGLNRTSFKDAVKAVLAELRLPVDNNELAALVLIRDRLVHSMQFSSELELSPLQQHGLLTTFAGRLILAALRYEGPYYDWRTRPPQVVKLERTPVPETDGTSEPSSPEVL